MKSIWKFIKTMHPAMLLLYSSTITLAITLYLLKKNPLSFVISEIGVQQNWYIPFIIIGFLITFSVTVILHSSIKKINVRGKKSILRLVWMSFPIIIASIIIPYERNKPFFQWSHTILVIIYALIAVFIMIKTNQHLPKKNKKIKYYPHLILLGTIMLFIIFGLTIPMEIFFFTIYCLWINELSTIAIDK